MRLSSTDKCNPWRRIPEHFPEKACPGLDPGWRPVRSANLTDARRHSLMAPVACSKCSVVAYETDSGGWRFDPSTGCVDLRDTEWGAKGALEWCPTIVAAMPD